MTCIFCDIIQGKKVGYFIFEDEEHVAFLDKYPIDNGHALVLPKKHYEKVIDMTAISVGNLFARVPKIAKAIIKTTHADAFSMTQNNGRAAKQIVPHVHIHIIPRYEIKGTVWTKRKIASEDQLRDLAKKIKTNLEL